MAISKSSMQRLVTEYGSLLANQQNEEAAVVWRARLQPDSEIMAISSDGVLINVIGEGWKEVKAVSISAVSHGVDGTDR